MYNNNCRFITEVSLTNVKKRKKKRIVFNCEVGLTDVHT